MSRYIQEYSNTTIPSIAVQSTVINIDDARLLSVVSTIQDKKGFDIIILDVSQVASFADYFILCTGSSTKHTQAIANEIEKKLGESGIYPHHSEGYSDGEWILFDYSDLIIHIFTPEYRSFYDLERLWHDAESIKIPAETQTDLSYKI